MASVNSSIISGIVSSRPLHTTDSKTNEAVLAFWVETMEHGLRYKHACRIIGPTATDAKGLKPGDYVELYGKIRNSEKIRGLSVVVCRDAKWYTCFEELAGESA